MPLCQSIVASQEHTTGTTVNPQIRTSCYKSSPTNIYLILKTAKTAITNKLRPYVPTGTDRLDDEWLSGLEQSFFYLIL